MNVIGNYRGYSLIEMATVLLVGGVLSAVAITRLSPVAGHAKVRGAANVVAGDLQYAQMLAARHRRPIAVIVASATQQYLIRDRDDPTNVYRTRVLGLGSGFDLDELTAAPSSSVEFYPNGLARATTTLTLGLHGFQRQVRLTRAGQIRILSP